MVESNLTVEVVFGVLNFHGAIKIVCSLSNHEPLDLCVRRPYLNFVTTLKLHNKGTVPMASSCVWVDYWPELERPVNLPPIVVLTPNLVACDRGMMRDLFQGDLISP